MTGLAPALVVALHVAYVAFVVVGLVCTVVGRVRGWEWVRNPWFRLPHLAAVLFVAASDLLGRDCPLTVLEQDLKRSAGEPVPQGSFVGRLLAPLFGPVPGWGLNLIFRSVGAAAVALLFVVPIRVRKRVS
jgi:hypothetical protein